MRKLTCILVLMIFAEHHRTVKKRICIVGAGLSGLVAAKYFGEYPDEFEVVVFEKNSNVGGMWIYTNSTSVDEHGLPVHSSIYKNLVTNSIKQIMSFPDYLDFRGEDRKSSYAKQEDILQYLRNYAEHFNLRQYVKFNTNVEIVKLLPNMTWLIRSQNLDTKQRSDISCDAVIICNGFNFKGYVPKIPGITSFTGRTLHSHMYREPEGFANQMVVLLGALFSGIDTSIDISSVAKKVYLSHRRAKLPDVFPPNVEQVPGVVAAESNKLILSNGTKISADALIFCTGYVYDFPFLDANSGIVVDSGKYVRSIYKHMINIEHPTMAFINVPEPGYHFRNPHAQVQYFRAVLRGEVSLPNRQEMLTEAQLPANRHKRKAHVLSDSISYYNELAVAAGGEPLPWWFGPGRDARRVLTARDHVHYKEKMFVIHENNRSVEFI